MTVTKPSSVSPCAMSQEVAICAPNSRSVSMRSTSCLFDWIFFIFPVPTSAFLRMMRTEPPRTRLPSKTLPPPTCAFWRRGAKSLCEALGEFVNDVECLSLNAVLERESERDGIYADIEPDYHGGHVAADSGFHVVLRNGPEASLLDV